MTESTKLGPVPKSHVVLLIAAALLGFFSNIWNTPLFDLDEGAFSEATIEMMHDGNYLTTTLDGEPRYDKPILIYWLQAASVKAFGVTEFAFRLPSALCATAWMLAVWGFARRFAGGNRAGLVAALTVPLGLMSGIIGHAAIADALLNLLIALAGFDLWRHFAQNPEQRQRLPLLRAYIWMGLGFLAKGPVAIGIPVLATLLFCLLQHRFRDWLKAAFDPVGWLLMVAVLSVWLGPLWFYDHWSFLDHFLLKQNLGRYSSTMQGHGGELWYYVLWLPLIVLPFTAMLPPVLRRFRHLRENALDAYLLLWFGTVFALVSMSATQLPHYLLYGCSGLFVLFGKYHEQAPRRVWALLPPLILMFLLAILPWVLPHIPIPPKQTYDEGIVHLAIQHLGAEYRIIAFTALTAIVVLMLWPGLATWRALLAAGFVQGMVVWFGVFPVLAAAQQQPVREAALKAKALGLPTVSYDTFMPSFSVYRGAPTPNRVPQPGELVFVRKDRVKKLDQALHGAWLIKEYQSGGIELYLYPANLQ